MTQAVDYQSPEYTDKIKAAAKAIEGTLSAEWIVKMWNREGPWSCLALVCNWTNRTDLLPKATAAAMERRGLAVYTRGMGSTAKLTILGCDVARVLQGYVD